MHVAISLAVVFVVLQPWLAGLKVALGFPAMKRRRSVSMGTIYTDSASDEQLDGGRLAKA
jgi:hypothetical protein